VSFTGLGTGEAVILLAPSSWSLLGSRSPSRSRRARSRWRLRLALGLLAEYFDSDSRGGHGSAGCGQVGKTMTELGRRSPVQALPVRGWRAAAVRTWGRLIDVVAITEDECHAVETSWWDWTGTSQAYESGYFTGRLLPPRYLPSQSRRPPGSWRGRDVV
jgi:hypothetical protein